MSQTIVPSGPAAAALPGSLGASRRSPRSRLSEASAAIRHELSGTPGQLRMVAVIAVLAALIAAVGGGLALHERSAALGEARSTSAHLVLVQRVQTELAQADADATNSFLNFGPEPRLQLLDYSASIQAASHDLAIAAQGSSMDADSLGAANALLTEYTGLIASARANNRVGLPVGANYLSTASGLLTTDKTGIFALLAKQSSADQKSINSAYTRAALSWIWLALVVILGLGGLLWAQWFVARRSRRILNLPLAAASVGVLVALIVGVAAMAFAQSHANDVRHGALAKATALSRSRVAAFTAKSEESLVLIARGSATPGDAEWKAELKQAAADLPSGNDDAAAALAAYSAQHTAINNLDVNNQWSAAVKRAVLSTKGSANAQFATYSAESGTALTAQARATSSGLGSAGNALLPAGILVVLAGLLAAAGAWWGISLRLDEYR